MRLMIAVNVPYRSIVWLVVIAVHVQANMLPRKATTLPRSEMCDVGEYVVAIAKDGTATCTAEPGTPR